jgi:hypothetical protein
MSFKLVLALASLMLVVSIGCNNTSNAKTDVTGPSSPVVSTVEKETYIYQGVKYDVLFNVTDSSRDIIETDASNAAIALLTHDNCGVCPDPKNSTISYLYFSDDEMKAVTDMLKAQYGLSKRKSDPANPPALLVACINNGCTDWNKKHLDFSKDLNWGVCLQAPWNDAFSELSWIYGEADDFAAINETCSESGHSFLYWYSSGHIDLRSKCMRKCMWWCCQSWNDVISRIRVFD